MAETRRAVGAGELIDRTRVRGVHGGLRETYARDGDDLEALARASLLIVNRGKIRQVDGFLQQGESGEPLQNTWFVLQQDLSQRLGGQGRAPSALAYMLMGVGL